MNRFEKALELIKEDVKILDHSLELADNMIQYFDEHPASTLWGTIGQGICYVAVGGLVGCSFGLAYNDVKAIVDGDPLRKPFEKSPLQLSEQPKLRNLSVRKNPSTRPRFTTKATRKAVRKTYRRIDISQYHLVDKKFLFSI